MTTITELENKLEALSHQHRIGSTTHDESRFEAYKANPELVKRIALRKNILKWHERLVSICNQSVHPSEKPLRDSHVREARADVLRELNAALKAAGAEDQAFINALLAMHESGTTDARAVLKFVESH